MSEAKRQAKLINDHLGTTGLKTAYVWFGQNGRTRVISARMVYGHAGSELEVQKLGGYWSTVLPNSRIELC